MEKIGAIAVITDMTIAATDMTIAVITDMTIGAIIVRTGVMIDATGATTDNQAITENSETPALGAGVFVG